MKLNEKIVSFFLMVVLIFPGCSSHKKIQPEDEFAVESTDPSAGSNELKQDLSLDEGLNSDPKTSTQNETNGSAASSNQPVSNAEASLDSELDSLGKESLPSEAPVAPVATTEPIAETQSAPQTQPETGLSEPLVSPPVQEVQVEPAKVDPPTEQVTTIENVQFVPNTNGGALSITGNQPLRYTTRMNSSTNQFVIEIENSKLPTKLKRTLNTKDMGSSIGSVDLYQKSGSMVSRFVVQLRPGSPEPVLQPEGNSLIVVGEPSTGVVKPEELSQTLVTKTTIPAEEVSDLKSDGIMSSDNLEEFLIGNSKFYGKRISIETSAMDIREVLKIIADEANLNLVVDSQVTGPVTLKLKSVPWDQALIVILKQQKLGFKRQGTVLRISNIDSLKKEEEAAIALKKTVQEIEPIIVRRFFIGYANLTEVIENVQKFIDGKRSAQEYVKSIQNGVQVEKVSKPMGSIIADKRSNSIIVTDTESNVKSIGELITAIDTQPQQVLIEAKLVESKESFSRGLGFFINSSPEDAITTNRATIGITPNVSTGSEFDGQFSWGALDLLGTLGAQLRLGERENKLKILTSPRITVLSNETANLLQGSSVPIIGSDGKVTYVQTGIILDVLPQVSNEGTVSLNLTVARSFPTSVSGLSKDERSIKTKLIVKSGQTAVLGGVFNSEVLEDRSGVPYLKNIPILGRLFEGEAESSAKNEIVMFVTPTILKPVTSNDKLTF